MKIERVQDSLLKVFESGDYNNPCNADGTWSQAIESTFLNTYKAAFSALAEVASLVESGDAGDTDLAMSQWTDPTQVFVVVVRNASATVGLAIKRGLDFLDEYRECALLFDDHPMRLVLLPGQRVMIPHSVNRVYLEKIGLGNEVP